MLDLIIYIEIALVVVFLLGQKIQKDKFNNVLTNLGLGVLLASVGLFALL